MPPVNDYYLLSPEIGMAGVAFLIVILDLFIERKGVVAALGFLGLGVPLGFTISLWGTTDTAFGGLLIVDQFSIFCLDPADQNAAEPVAIAERDVQPLKTTAPIPPAGAMEIPTPTGFLEGVAVRKRIRMILAMIVRLYLRNTVPDAGEV